MSNSTYSLIFLLLIICNYLCCFQAENTFFHLPESFKAEGKILLTYNHNGQASEQHLAFTEVVDGIMKRSKTSIGYTISDPVVYYNHHSNLIKVYANGRCEPIKEPNQINLIPELDWYAKMTYTQEELEKYWSSVKHRSGPSILTELALLNAMPLKTSFGPSETYRNMECEVIVAKYSRKKAQDLTLECLKPPVDLFSEVSAPYFVFREKSMNTDDGRGYKLDISFSIDYYSVEAILDDDLERLRSLEYEFSLPPGVGCSGLVEKKATILPNIPKSFIMNFHQFSKQETILLAYDQVNGYLRRERLVYGSVSTWDLRENLHYSVDFQDDFGKLLAQAPADETGSQESIKSESCSVLHVDDPTLGASHRYYTNYGMDIFEFFGAKNLAYMGPSKVRDMNCRLFETVLTEAPIIFGLNTNMPDRGLGKFDYIVQFYLLSSSMVPALEVKIGRDFWPARINLIKRHIESGELQFLDSIEVTDFHWGLFGMPRKPSELFMAQECFDIEDEQVRIELLLEFHTDVLDMPVSFKILNNLRENKYFIEQELLNDLFEKVFKVSRMHLTEFELTLRQHDAVLNMVLADRQKGSSLKYLGKGELQTNGANNQIELPINEEFSCVTTSSHIDNVSAVAFYPRNKHQSSRCIASVEGGEPVVRRITYSDPLNDPFEQQDSVCYVHSFSKNAPFISGLKNLSEWRHALLGHEFKFQLGLNGELIGDVPNSPSSVYKAKVHSVDVERAMPLEMVNDYRFTLDGIDENSYEQSNQSSPLVRSFPMMSYVTIGDCANMCNLDVACLSYSYCSLLNKKVPENQRCLLSSLDIRLARVNHQLLGLDPQGSKKSVIFEHEGQKDEYKLNLAEHCNIHEKDYLNSFSETGEILTMPASNETKFSKAASATICARAALDIEAVGDQIQLHTMAYCPTTQVCLLESEIFTELENGQTSQEEDDDDEQSSLDENVPCLVYRRKYQTFFHVSPKVLKRDNNEELGQHTFSQLPLKLSTVEECARACWNQFGHICVSFDYCSVESLCLINSFIKPEMDEGDENNNSMKVVPQEEFDRLSEKRTNCLHYERDLRIDQIRRLNAALRHQVLDLSLANETTKQGWTFGRIFLNVVLFCSVLASFLAGLALGRQVNDHLEQNELISNGTDRISNYFNNILGGNGNEEGDAVPFSELEYNQVNAIQMEEIKSKVKDAGSDELQS